MNIKKEDASPPPYVRMEEPSGSEQTLDSGTTFIGFDEKTIRLRFIRKVFLILLCQLAFTFAFIAICTFVKPVSVFMLQYPALIYTSYITFLVLYILLVCIKKLRRVYPHNLVFLCIFTLTFTYFVSALTINFDSYSVITAFGTCIICCGVIVAFSFNTKYDLTSWVGFLLILSTCLFIFGISFTFPNYENMHRLYSLLAAIIFMAFLAIDIHLLMWNKTYALSPEEYIFAALQLYIDVMYIFIMMLFAGGKRS